MLAKAILIFCIIFCNYDLHAFQTYEIFHFGLANSPNIVGSQATCINNNGEVAGSLSITGPSMHHSAFIWTKEKGLVEIFPNLMIPPNDINDLGHIVGALPGPKGPYGYIWTSNEGLKSFSFCPDSINNSGMMCGKSGALAALTSDGHHSSPMNLEESIRLRKTYLLRNYSEFATAINNRCEVVGKLIFSGSRLDDMSKIQNLYSHGFFWTSNGECVDFGTNKIPIAINDNSQIVLVTDFSEKGSCLLWQQGKYIFLWGNGLAKAINNHAQIVGTRNASAVIWENGQTIDLADLVENTNGWTNLSIATDINDRGEIVGRGIFKGKQTAFLLLPLRP